jgi:glycosyltransferase involved in cell wall biosynthesis
VVVSEGQGAKWLNAVKQAEGLTNLLVLPYQPFTDLPDLLASGDVLIAILESEAGVFSVPSKVLSYLCAKRPILLSVPKENLSSRMVQVANAGLAVEPGDLKGFNSAASALYHDSSLRDENGRNGRRFAETNFDISTITEKFLIALGIT